jgi:hypothetical protein
MRAQPDPPPALPQVGLRAFIHKLNNQLTVVMAHSELGSDVEDPAEMRRSLRAISRAAMEMAATVREFAGTSPLLLPEDAQDGVKESA